MPVEAKYHTTATASGGGRDGKTTLTDGTMDLQLTVPKELGGPGGDGANPEKLFALGYSACFLGAMRVASAQTKIKVPEGTTVTANIGIGPRSEGGFGITAALDVMLPGLPEADAHTLVEATHGICPYSNAIKASVALTTTTPACVRGGAPRNRRPADRLPLTLIMSVAPHVKQLTHTLTVATAGKGLVPITKPVFAWVAQAGITTGLLTVFIRHTSASLLIQENADPTVRADLEAFFAWLVPENVGYRHDTEGPDDMPAHIRAALTQTQLSVPVMEGAMVLGMWQGLYVWEHRTAPHRREVVLHLLGD